MQQPDASDDRRARLIGIDYLRGFVVVLVVLHHAILAYCAFGHFNVRHYLWSTAPIVDAQRWSGFDIIVLFNDSFFMPLMFLLSGLFVRPSLTRKGRVGYLLDRFRRLVLPFALAVLTIMPLALYPSYRMTGAEVGFATFWIQTVLEGPWPNGPAWFIAVLFGFDLVAALVLPLSRGSAVRPAAVPLGFLTALTLGALLPLLMVYGPVLWFRWGPFSIQASRILLYAAYFFVGVAAGPGLRIRGRRPVTLACGLFALLLAVQMCRLRIPGLVSPFSWLLLYGLTMGVFCAAATRASLMLFARFERRFALWDSLSANAYGIYLVHYLFVVWGQYALLGWDIGAIPKALCVFIGALGLSWGCVAGFRAIPSFVALRRG